MKTGYGWTGLCAAAVFATASGTAGAQSSVQYGRITAVTMVTQDSTRAQTGGALVGGALGVASGSGQSGSNRALRGVAGGFAGQQVGRIASQRQAFEYTILIGGTSTVRMVTDEAGMRVGDCVAVERGNFNNLRLVDDARCTPRPRTNAAPAAQAKAAPAPEASPAAVREANACVQAKEQLLKAETEQAFDFAERRVRLLCND
jgi:outer membrane lipoprotein SlyB